MNYAYDKIAIDYWQNIVQYLHNNIYSPKINHSSCISCNVDAEVCNVPVVYYSYNIIHDMLTYGFAISSNFVLIFQK